MDSACGFESRVILGLCFVPFLWPTRSGFFVLVKRGNSHFELCFWHLFSEESSHVELPTLPVLLPGVLHFALMMRRLGSGEGDGNKATLFLKTVPLFIFFVSLLHWAHMHEVYSRCYEHGVQSYHKIRIWVVWVSYNSSFFFIIYTSRKQFNDCFDFCHHNAWHSASC